MLPLLKGAPVSGDNAESLYAMEDWPMKKTPKRLMLAKETLCSLQESHLEQAVGGFNTLPASVCKPCTNGLCSNACPTTTC